MLQTGVSKVRLLMRWPMSLGMNDSNFMIPGGGGGASSYFTEVF
jgi:hypothetical protein